MSVSVKLREYLDQNKIKYTLISHSIAYTAQELAAKMHVPGQEMAKVVIVKINGRFVMAVMPAHHQIDFERLKEATGAHQIELATERELQNLFPDCEVGAMPPFGNIYGLSIYLAKSLEEDKEIVYNAGSHTEAIRMEYGDFIRLANPTVIEYTHVVNIKV
ncbi:MAG: YbaK/EbsC family protein [Deltaproteobacteria bacterium]|nr:YbaK/EbsC family protein [Deltaproteobacteria bacterium]